MGAEVKEKRKQFNKPKPWDDDPTIDRWKVENFDPAWNPTGMLEASSFSSMFPRYRVANSSICHGAWDSVQTEFGRRYDDGDNDKENQRSLHHYRIQGFDQIAVKECSSWRGSKDSQ